MSPEIKEKLENKDITNRYKTLLRSLKEKADAEDIKEMEVFSFHKEAHPFRTLEEIEKEYIHWVMAKAGKNKSRTARILGIDRVSLYRKLKKYQIVEE